MFEMWFRKPGCMAFSVTVKSPVPMPAQFVWDAMTEDGYEAVSARP